MYTKIKNIVYIYILLSFLFINQAYAISTHSVATANRIGKSYAYKIKEKLSCFENFSSALLCNKFILHDMESNNKDEYFLSDYLIKNYNENFTLRTFKSCVMTLDLIKTNNILKNQKLIERISNPL